MSDAYNVTYLDFTDLSKGIKMEIIQTVQNLISFQGLEPSHSTHMILVIAQMTLYFFTKGFSSSGFLLALC